MSKYIQQSVFEKQHENNHKKHKFYDNNYAPLIYDRDNSILAWISLEDVFS